MRHSLVAVLLGLSIVLGPRLGAAQAIRLDVEEAPLEEAIAALRNQAALDVVYAERQVRDQRVSCHYTGDDSEAALACLLADTGLRAERVRRRQYVLASLPDATAEADLSVPLRIPRGLLIGYVSDARTGEFLPGAHVYLPDLRWAPPPTTPGISPFRRCPSAPTRCAFPTWATAHRTPS